MDAGAFLQENRKWLLGVAGGVVLWFIGSSIIASIYDPKSIMSKAQVASSSAGTTYDDKAKSAAEAERERLAAEVLRLQRELEFSPRPQFTLDNQGLAPDDYVIKIGRGLKGTLNQIANQHGIALDDRSMRWEMPSDTEGYRSVLFGLDMLDEACRRLFAVHEERRTQDPAALGCTAIRLLQIDARKRGAAPARGPQKGVVLSDLYTQERLQFEFDCDGATAVRFLERCREDKRTLVLEQVSAVPVQRAPGLVTVKGALLGIRFLPREENQ